MQVDAFATGDFQPARIEPQLMQHCCMDVSDVVGFLHRVKTDLIGGAVREAALNSAAGQPAAEALWMMIPAGWG